MKGKNNYTHVGKFKGQAVFEKGGQLFIEKDYRYLYRMSEDEEQEFQDQKEEFSN